MDIFSELRKPLNRIILSKVVGYLIPISRVIGTYERMILCPFHPDTNPSAKVYSEDDDQIEKLYCHSCRKFYTSYHYIKDILRKDPLFVLKENFQTPIVLQAYEMFKDGDSVIRNFDSTEYLHLLENFNLEEFLLRIYRVV